MNSLTKLRVFSHYLYIDIYHHIPWEHCIFHICSLEPKIEGHKLYSYALITTISEMLFCLFKDLLGSLETLMASEYQRCLRIFIWEILHLVPTLKYTKLLASYIQPSNTTRKRLRGKHPRSHDKPTKCPTPNDSHSLMPITSFFATLDIKIFYGKQQEDLFLFKLLY